MSVLDIIIGPIFKVIDKLIPDQAAKAQMQLQVLQMQQAGEFKELEEAVALAKQQNDINAIEAASPDPFKSNWRPAVGWTCVAGLVYQFLIMPILPWLITSFGGHTLPLPAIDNGTLMTLLGGLLGLGGMRTLEKIKGVA
jgi:Holin of 3TMs, for gene-transfer release